MTPADVINRRVSFDHQGKRLVGVVTAATGRDLRFFPAPNDAPCDACALDATSPARPAGQAFPSGSAHPPLHAGCACTVVPV